LLAVVGGIFPKTTGFGIAATTVKDENDISGLYPSGRWDFQGRIIQKGDVARLIVDTRGSIRFPFPKSETAPLPRLSVTSMIQSHANYVNAQFAINAAETQGQNFQR
jgi:hypothetical protein